MALKVSLVGSTDRQLDEFLRVAGMKVSALDMASLSGLAAVSAPQPDVIVLDLRTDARIPPAISAIRRQHPPPASSSLPQTWIPQFCCRRCAPASTSWSANRSRRPTSNRPSAASWPSARRAEVGKVFGFVGAKGGVGTTTVAVNVASVLGGTTRGTRALLDGLAPGGRRCGGVSRLSSRASRSRTRWTTPTGSTPRSFAGS